MRIFPPGNPSRELQLFLSPSLSYGSSNGRTSATSERIRYYPTKPHNSVDSTKEENHATKQESRITEAQVRCQQENQDLKAVKAQASKKSTSAGRSRAEGIRLFTLAGRPSKEDFIKVYGPNGPKMTWEQRAEAGVPAEKFQAALAAKHTGR